MSNMLSKEKGFARNPELVPDFQWKKWTRKNLPNKEFLVSDIDSIIRTIKGCVYLIEIKRKGARVKEWQKMTYGLIAAALKAAEGKTLKHEYLPKSIKCEKFLGVVELTFENTWFDNGKTYWSLNGKGEEEVTEEEVKQRLSFDRDCSFCFDPSLCDCSGANFGPCSNDSV